MNKHLLILITACALAGASSAETDKTIAQPDRPDDGERVVQLALLLDTSNSMDGLISQAKTQLWKIVNEFISAKQEGKTPVVQVALYEYGNNRLSKENNWIRQVQPLTRDLDKLSEELFKLSTSGGEEYCGAVIKAAINDLAWDPASSTYKAIFIAGNEPFTQGSIDPNKSCKAAIAKGIIVNTIHCGDEQTGVNEGWKKGALLADGNYLFINQNQAVAHVPSPYDSDIERLSADLNKTYISYGARGKMAASNQATQDANALAPSAKAAGASVQRAVTKSSANYCNKSWDLVDASKDKSFTLKSVKEEDLPDDLKKLKPEERQAYIDAKAAERAKIQTEIADFSKKRADFVASKQKEQGKENTLDKAVSKAIRSQAGKKNILFANESGKQ